ncbi:MAG: hypothetical protein AMXMBFR47_09740 [Planctomycetota bacterium]
MAARPEGFSVIELLVVVAVISVLAAALLPSLVGARDRARGVKCLSNLRQLGLAQSMYTGEFAGRVIPAAYTTARIIGNGPPVFWWGAMESDRIDHERGFVWPYLRSDLRESGVFECPNQPWGSYAPQGLETAITSTYGYNGYYLSPPHTPGWSSQISGRPWQTVERVGAPSTVLAFGDSMLAWSEEHVTNTVLLDPPRVYAGNGRWTSNPHPTQSFRHAGRTGGVFMDGHAAQLAPRVALRWPGAGVGAITGDNDPYYVPDWRDW